MCLVDGETMPKAAKFDRRIATAIQSAQALVLGLALAFTWIGTSCAQPPVSHGPVDHAAQLFAAGDRDEAERLLRKHLLAHPQDDQAYQALLNMNQPGELSANSAACRLAQQKLPKDFAVVQSPRFVLLTDAGVSAAQQHARWVERACEEFDRFAAHCGLRPLPLQHKLVCVLFEQHDDYQSFARHHDGMNNAAFTGYYSPKHDRVVFSLASESQLADAQSERGRNKKGASPSKPVLGFDSAANSDASHDHASCGDVHLSSEAAAKCVHETIHQLMFHTRLMSADLQYPLWICEGLSTAFETETPEAAFGPDRDFEPRRRGFDNLLRRNEVLPLRELVTLTSLSNCKPQFIRAVYHESYGLVTWLCRNHPTKVRDYLQAMLREPSGKLSPQRHLELFEQSFGPVDQLEPEWLAQEYAALGK